MDHKIINFESLVSFVEEFKYLIKDVPDGFEMVFKLDISILHKILNDINDRGVMEYSKIVNPINHGYKLFINGINVTILNKYYYE